MAIPVRMPQLGVTMTEARLLRWLKPEGSAIAAGEAIAEIETDKLLSEIQAPAQGVLRRIIVSDGAMAPVHGLLAVIADATESEDAIQELLRESKGHPLSEILIQQRIQPPAPQSSTPPRRITPLARRLAEGLGVTLEQVTGQGPSGRITEADVRSAARAQSPPGSRGWVRASPWARRLARERRIDLTMIAGSGPEGRVIGRDVLAASTPPPPSAAQRASGLRRRETIPLDTIRRTTGQRLRKSLDESVPVTLTTEADATALVELRNHLLPTARVYGHPQPTYTDLLVHLVARTLKNHPLLNSSIVGDEGTAAIAYWDEVNIAVAVATDRGLLAPVIREADRKHVDQISQELATLSTQARNGTLPLDALGEGTFTITNLGQLGIDAFTPVINPPQCAILGIGRIVPRPAVVDGSIVVRQSITFSLTFDHRILDGWPAAAFLHELTEALDRLLERSASDW
ncbi:MAG: 2-oxo acid dehydrogenase subunit E2 [Chloroflexi bacterium]|nr:2-oxo acid dehydrogenase subunit E2 [Chloroflexota bacterium]